MCAIHRLCRKILGLALLWPALTQACTDFTIPHQDGVVVAARSMEFGIDFKSRIVVRPRGEFHQSQAPDGSPGVSWTSKYGYVGVNVFDLKLDVDGVNEAGLSAGMLWMVGTQYQEVPKGKESTAIRAHEVINWILGNFATVDEVKEAIQKVHVWGHYLPDVSVVPPLHFPIHDANGKSIVIEYVRGQLHVHDNHVGVLTNSPPFEWQVVNLQTYNHLTNMNRNSMADNGVHGSGMFGVPGDATPPSRFVKLAVQREHVNPVATAEEGVRLARHLLNTVSIPKGVVKSHDEDDVYHEDHTQWVVIKDLKNKVFYYSSYESLTLYSVDLNKLDLSGAKECKSRCIYQGQWAEDISHHLM